MADLQRLVAAALAALVGATAWAGSHLPEPPSVDRSTLPASAVVRPANPNGEPHQAEARLLAETTAVRPGVPVRIGVELVPDPKWHSYWKSPGDIGMPLTFVWTLPDGTTVAPHEFPVPTRFDQSGIVSYGYDGPVLVFSELTPPADLAPGATFDARVEASWLVCDEICVPGKADLHLPLPVADTTDEAAHAAPWAPLFDHYAAFHPTPLVDAEAIGVEHAFSESAFRPGDAFEAAFLISPTGEQSLTFPVETGTWPTFVPIFDGYEIYVYETAFRALDDGRAIVVMRGDALEVDTLPVASRVGGLFQIQVGDRMVQTEYTVPVTWAPVGSDVVKSTSPLWPLLSAEPATAAPAVAATPRAPPTPQDLAWMLAFALLGGLILNVMPCVFPVITLKLFSLVSHVDASPGERKVKALAYTLGVLASFWALAAAVLVARLTIGSVGWGFQFQSPTFVAVLTAIVFAFGLSLFGVFEVPVFGADAAAAATSRGGLGGDFLYGAFATLLATPCSAPFLGTAIGFAFTQPIALIFVFFTVIGLGLALPFVAVAFVPALFRALPAPGPWMETFKQFLGFTLIATAIWLLDVLGDHVGPERLMGFVAFLGALSLGAWIFGRWGDVAQSRGRQAGAFAVAALVTAGGAWAFVDLDVPEAECAPGDAPTEVVWDGGQIPWQPFSDARVAALEGQPMFIDFTASWCLTCKVNERTVLRDATVVRAMEDLGIVPLMADWTRRDPEITAWLTRFGRAGVPFYLVMPADPSAPPIVLPEVITPSMVVDALRAAAPAG